MSSMKKAEHVQCFMCLLRVTVAVELKLDGIGGRGPCLCSDCLASALTLTGEYYSAEPIDQGTTRMHDEQTE